MKMMALKQTHFVLPKRLYIFILISGLACLFALWAVLTCLEHKTTIHPHSPEKTSCLLTSGAFHYSRNPMYFSLFLFLFAWGLYLGNFVAIIFSKFFLLSITILQIIPEEKALLKRFGTKYEEYQSSVRRWI